MALVRAAPPSSPILVVRAAAAPLLVREGSGAGRVCSCDIDCSPGNLQPLHNLRMAFAGRNEQRSVSRLQFKSEEGGIIRSKAAHRQHARVQNPALPISHGVYPDLLNVQQRLKCYTLSLALQRRERNQGRQGGKHQYYDGCSSSPGRLACRAEKRQSFSVFGSLPQWWLFLSREKHDQEEWRALWEDGRGLDVRLSGVQAQEGESRAGGFHIMIKVTPG